MSELLEQENTQTVESAFRSISDLELEKNNWPMVVHIEKSKFAEFNNVRESRVSNTGVLKFWKEIFSQDNFVGSNTTINEKDEILFVLHSLKDENGIDCIFTAVTTSIKEFIKDPENSINYNLHGKPCENRSRGNYPTVNFWDFYDNLSISEQEKPRIPDTNWRRSFYKNLKKR